MIFFYKNIVLPTYYHTYCDGT